MAAVFEVFRFAITVGGWLGIRGLNLKAPYMPVDNKSDYTTTLLSFLEIGCCALHSIINVFDVLNSRLLK